MPKVSVIIPCYNYARYLPESVGSVMAQTFRDFEVIIVNDGSTDDTREVALRFADTFGADAVRLVDQENMGLPTARNNGIKVSRGEYFLPLDADDMIKPGFIEKAVEAMESGPALSVVYTQSEIFGAESGIYYHKGFKLRSLLMHEGPCCTALIRKSAWVEAGGYNPYMSKGFEDWEFYLNLFERGCKGMLIPEPLFMWRRHGFSMSDDVGQNYSMMMIRNLKLLHPKLFEPSLSRVSTGLARAVVWLKYWTRDRLMRYIYLKHPGFHAWLRNIKYGRTK